MKAKAVTELKELLHELAANELDHDGIMDRVSSTIMTLEGGYIPESFKCARCGDDEITCEQDLCTDCIDDEIHGEVTP